MSATLAPLAVAPLWEHQAQAVDFAEQRAAVMWAIGMGGGKSRSAIETLERHHRERVLILCPRNVVGVWPSQFSEYATRDWHTWNGTVLGARGPLKNPSVAKRAGALCSEACVARYIAHRPFAAIVNYEASHQGAMRTALLEERWDTIVLDEAHRCRSAGGVTSRFVARLTARCRDRGGQVLALTGTPMPHSPLDLYGTYRALDPTIFGTSAAAFRARYGAKRIKYVDQRSGEPVYLTGPRGEPIYDGLRPDRTTEFMARAGSIMFHVSQEELDERLGLEEPVDTYRTCELEPASRAVYDDLERDLIAQVGDGVVTAANAMVLVTRLCQVTSGYAPDAEHGGKHAIADPPAKARLLADLLEDTDPAEPLVVFARFHHDLDQIERVARGLGRRYGELSGRRRDGLADDSRMAPGVDILGAQVQAAAEGIDLTRARTGIFYTVGFELANYMQAKRRILRPGQARRVTYIHLLAESTIDRALYGALRRRKRTVDAVLGALGSNERKAA